MAEEQYVRMGQFSEFMKRVDERFDHVNELADQRFDSINQRFLDLEKRMEQGFFHAEKAREQNFVYLNQRLDDVSKRFDDVQAEIRSLRTLIVALYTPIILGVLGAVLKYLFFSS